VELFLLWRRDEPTDAGDVAAKLQRIFAPLFSELPAATIHPSLVVLHLPVRGWKRPFFERGDDEWAHAIDYPIDWQSSLMELTRELDRDHDAALQRVSPPFSLLWSRGDAIHAANDALGQAQLFEFDDGKTWALTNRIMALDALGISLRPRAEAWAAHATLGWFPGDLTGFENVRRLHPGTRLRITRDGVQRDTSDVLRRWLHPESRSIDEWLEIARVSLLDHLRVAASGWDEAFAGLTGGRDSRAVVASLRATGVPFHARVKGRRDSSDVAIACKLARAANLPLRIEEDAELPSSDADDWRRSISLALLWQAGEMDPDKQKTIFSNGRTLPEGVVNVMGQHGEIARALRYRKPLLQYGVDDLPWSDAELEKNFMQHLISRRPCHLRSEWHDAVYDILLSVYRAADRYDLHGLARLDFFYLYENTRRFNAGSLASQTNLVVTPFLNPRVIETVYALPPIDKATFKLHDHIVAANAPEWTEIEYAPPLEPRAISNYFDAESVWRTTGAPLVDAALRNGGFCTEVFDEKLAREDASGSEDEIVMLSML